MKNVLIIGSTGQIGSELTMKLRSIYNGNIVAGYIPGAEPKGELKESGPSAIVDITNEQQIADLFILHPVFLHNSRIFFFRSPGRFGMAIKISCTSYFSAAHGILLSFPTIGAPRMVLPILFLSASITQTTRLRISGLFSIFFIRKFALSPPHMYYFYL